MTDGLSETWPYADYTPYDVLGVSTTSGIGDIRSAFKRRALETHPDKLIHHQQHDADLCARLPFTVVKEAAEILLDPLVRHRYDTQRSQHLVRESGAVSDVYVLRDDFELVTASGESLVWVYQMECRCGGTYEVVLFADPATDLDKSTQKRSKRCECDCCSLVVEVVLS